jgi:hypothetical protein
MRSVYRKVVACSTAFFFFVYGVTVPTALLADTPDAPGTIASVEEGQAAPFSGTLFSVPAAAKLLLDLKYNKESCRIEIDREKGILGAQLQLKIDMCNASFESLQFKHNQLMQIKNNQIDFLGDQMINNSWYHSGEFWFALGLVGGVLVTIGAGYALGQVD